MDECKPLPSTLPSLLTSAAFVMYSPAAFTPSPACQRRGVGSGVGGGDTQEGVRRGQGGGTHRKVSAGGRWGVHTGRNM